MTIKPLLSSIPIKNSTLREFTIKHNEYLKKDIVAFYHADYTGHNNPGNPNYINDLKNTFDNFSAAKLDNAVQELKSVLLKDLPEIFKKLKLRSIFVCVVPRAKTNYRQTQLLFKSTVRDVVNQLDGFYDGVNCISRHTNTKTTHFRKEIPNYNNDGRMPYRGITADTCSISNDVKGKDVLLIDDVYTHGVNIVEDAIQALLDNGASSVLFYSIGKTINS